MRTRRLYLYIFTIILTTLTFFSCIEETWPELKNNAENLLVVEGKITNRSGPYTIKLSTTLSLSSILETNNFNPYRNAAVSITDDLNNSEILTEIEPGIYQTSEGGIQGIVGRSYKLSITSTNGNTYESDFEELLKPIGIDTIYTKEIIVDEVIPGYQFVLTTDENLEYNNFFLWELSETYEYHAPYKPTHVYEGKYINAYSDPDGNFHRGSYDTIVPHNIPKMQADLELQKCWKTNKLNTIYKHSTKFLTEAKISDFPLNFIHFSHDKLRVKYSLNVSQHAISEKAYKYFIEIEEQNSFKENELYTKQPYQMRGNIKNINNANEAVLGFFYTSGVSEKRIFAPKDPKKINKIVFSSGHCQTIPSISYAYGPSAEDKNDSAILFRAYNNIELYLELIQNNSNSWPVYFGKAYIQEPDKMFKDWPNWFVPLPNQCFDCRERGGTLQKPIYWNN